MILYHKYRNVIIFMIYLDDISVTGNNAFLVQSFIDHLNLVFALEDFK